MAQDSIFYSYTKNINGFAAHVEEDVANQIASKKRKQFPVHTYILVDGNSSKREGGRTHHCCCSIDGAEHPDVVTVLESKMLKLHTTRSWDFMDLERDGQILPESIWKHAKFGQDVIIANLDSGRRH